MISLLLFKALYTERSRSGLVVIWRPSFSTSTLIDTIIKDGELFRKLHIFAFVSYVCNAIGILYYASVFSMRLVCDIEC